MLKMIDVVAAIIEQDGQILLAQRPPHADQPGMWEFAGGKVEPGESQPQALARELQEEMGIIARHPGQTPKSKNPLQGMELYWKDGLMDHVKFIAHRTLYLLAALEHVGYSGRWPRSARTT